VSNRYVGAVGAAAAMIAAAWLSSPLSARGQTPAAAAKPTSANATSTLPRTPDGQPDIRGVWSKTGGGIQEAHPPKTPLNDTKNAEGADAFGVNAEPIGFSNVTTEKARIAPEGPRRTTGVVDPPDKVLPWRPEADAKRREFISKMIPPPSLQYLEMNSRCAPPAPWAGGAMQILQRPGAVVMVFENDHASRNIALDGRPHLGPAFRFFMGDSVGRWEGNTLVVDTTNLNGNAEFGRDFPYYSDAMHVIERFTVADANSIDYEIAYDDPKLFTRPIKSVGYLTRAFKEYELRENACAEGSHTLRNIFGF